MTYAEFLQRTHFSKADVLASAWGTLVEDQPPEGMPTLPAPPMLMVDRIVEISHRGPQGRIVAEHDGYMRLADPVTHRRSVSLDAPAGVLTVADTLEMRGEHDVSLYFHLSEAWSLERHDGRTVFVAAGARRIAFELDDRLTVHVLHGSLSPRGGWLSRGYHQRTAICTIAGTARFCGTSTLTTRIAFGTEI